MKNTKWIVTLLLAALPLSAFDVKQTEDSLSGRSLALPTLSANYDAAAVSAYLSSAEWQSFNASNGGQWFAQVDTLTGKPRRAFGGAIPWVPGEANSLSGSYSPALLESKARAFISANPSLFGATNAQLSFVPEAAMGDRDGRLRVAAFDYYVNGIKVETARLAFAVNNGNMIYWNSSNIAQAPVSTTAAISSDAATSALLAHAGVGASDTTTVQSAILKLVPKNSATGVLTYQLAYELAFRLRGGQATWAGYVDAVSGAPLAFGDTNRYADASCPTNRSTATGKVTGGIRQAQATDPEIVRSFPFVQVDTSNGAFTTNQNGLFTWFGGAVSSSMSGSFFNDFCIDCLESEANPIPQQAFIASRGNGRLNFGSGGKETAGAFKQPTVVYGNGTSTVTSRTAFYHLNVARGMAKKWINLPWLEVNVPTNVNINDVCNAFWNGESTNFFRSGFGTATLFCRNTGEIRDVMQHEWGHGVDANDGVGTGYAIALGLGDFGTGEAVGDHIALFVDHDPCIGQSFAQGRNTGDFIDPETGAKIQCDGVRDADELRAKRGNLSTVNALQKCPPPSAGNPLYIGPLVREGHCEGEIWGQAAWHLIHNLTTGRSYSTATLAADKIQMTYAGDPIKAGKDGSANPGFGSDAAWTIYERLFYISRPLVAVYAPSRFTPQGTSAYDGLMVADDSGDGLGNGTPHGAYINDAFVHHGMEEYGMPDGVPSVGDSANCASVAAPPFTLTQAIDGATGAPSVKIAWNPVAGSNVYRVYRTERRNDVFLEVGTTGAGTYSIVDAGVDNGVKYFYRVVAFAASTCFSASGNVQSITIAQPEIRFASVGITDSPLGNNDKGLDAGERARLLVRLSNSGLTGLTNVTATIRSLTPGVSVRNAGPVKFNSIAIGGTASGTSSFEIELDKSFALCGKDAEFVLTITSDQGCLVESFAIPIGNDGTSCVVFKDVHAQPIEMMITNDRLASTCGDGDNIPDPGETFEVAVKVNNTGTKSASNVSVTLATDRSYLSFVSPQTVVIPTLGPGGTDIQTVAFRLSVGRTAPFDDLAVLTSTVGSGTTNNTLALETRVNRDKAARSYSYDFEIGEQGWNSSDPAKAWKRATAPTTGNLTTLFYSQYAPSTCNTLTSPIFEFSATSSFAADVASATEFDGHAYDGSDVQISIDGGKTWTFIEPTGGYPVASAGTSCIPLGQPQYGGVNPTMTRYTFDLSSYAGNTGQIRFRFQADPLVEIPQGGVWVDNIVAADMITPVPSAICP